jgi:hypothetical protein
MNEKLVARNGFVSRNFSLRLLLWCNTIGALFLCYRHWQIQIRPQGVKTGQYPDLVVMARVEFNLPLTLCRYRENPQTGWHKLPGRVPIVGTKTKVVLWHKEGE